MGFSAPKASTQRTLAWVLGAIMSVAGVLHFANPAPFVHIVPPYFPAPRMLVYVSGVFEIVGGLGLLVGPTRRWAAYGLIALYIAIFPANLNMALHHIGLDDGPPPPSWVLWARLPLQGVLIAWAWYLSRPPTAGGRTEPGRERRPRRS